MTKQDISKLQDEFIDHFVTYLQGKPKINNVAVLALRQTLDEIIMKHNQGVITQDDSSSRKFD